MTAKGSTIKDVARLAGVSVATVSRVLTGSVPVRAETRQRVTEAARTLRFVPNGAARSLSTRRTGTIGVLLPDLHGEFFSELLRGMDQAAQGEGCHLLVSSSHHEASGIAAALRAMHGRVDGLVVMAPDVDADALGEALPASLPTVLLNCAATASTAQALGVDNVGGAHAMVQHLAGLGHRRIAFVSGPLRNADAAERRRGYRDAMRALALPVPAAYCPVGDFTEESGWSAAHALLGLPEPPTAIFAANDMMALGVLLACREAGLEVPRAMTVVGFDDIPVARYMHPALTTVRIDVDALGRRAAALLLAAIETRAPRDARTPRRGATRARELVPTTLVVRDSCGAATAMQAPTLTSPGSTRGGARPPPPSRAGRVPASRRQSPPAAPTPSEISA